MLAVWNGVNERTNSIRYEEINVIFIAGSWDADGMHAKKQSKSGHNGKQECPHSVSDQGNQP